MATTLLIGSVDCNDGVSTRLMAMTLGKPGRYAEEYGGPTVDIAAVGSLDTSQLVESRFSVEVSAASVDAVTAIVASIAAEVEGLADIRVGLDGSAYTGTLKVRIGECIEIPLEEPWNVALMVRHTTRVEVVVRREPWIYGPPATALYTATGFDLPAIVDLSAMQGQAPAPLGIEVTAPSADIRCFWAGLYPDPDAVLTDFVHAMAYKSWTSGNADAEAAGWPDGVPNTIWMVYSDTLSTTTIDTSDLEPGEYLVLARCKCLTTTPFNVYAGASAVEAEMLSASVDTTALEWFPIGVVSLPTQAVRGSTAAPLYIGMKTEGISTIAINCVALVPTSWGMVGWRDVASHCHTLSFEGSMVYADDVASLGKAVGGRQLRTLGGLIVAVGGRSSSVAPVLHTHWTL